MAMNAVINQERDQMRSYVVTKWGQPMQVVERTTPVPSGSEVLVRVSAAGVCHSDIHIYEGYYDLGGGKRLLNDDRGVHAPRVMGHEIAGVIEAVGPTVDGVTIGDEVVVYPWIGCGQCDACALGEEQNCPHIRTLGIITDGGYSTHVLVPDARYCVALDGVAPEVASLLACSGITALHALRKFDERILTSEPLLIVGAGGLGLQALAVHRAMGGFGAIVADISAEKRQIALAQGAMAVIDPTAEDAADQIKSLAPSGRGLRMALDMVGMPATVNLAISVMVKGCKIVVVGLMGGELTIPIPYIPSKAMSLEGSYVGTLAELRDLMEMARDGRLASPPTETHPLDDAQEVLEALRAGKINGRGVLVP
ncbi:MAG: alcohol dehydrogenase [Thermomicrobiales bacterium]|nr:alcohol dehydrogenase [Thermomicrobiales bacterium]